MCNTYRRDKKHKILIEKSETERLLGRTNHRWENSIVTCMLWVNSGSVCLQPLLGDHVTVDVTCTLQAIWRLFTTAARRPRNIRV
jgi:hypothetical protein